jgi:hypothetical protein
LVVFDFFEGDDGDVIEVEDAIDFDPLKPDEVVAGGERGS